VVFPELFGGPIEHPNIQQIQRRDDAARVVVEDLRLKAEVDLMLKSEGRMLIVAALKSGGTAGALILAAYLPNNHIEHQKLKGCLNI
jgi:hypothetical protein